MLTLQNFLLMILFVLYFNNANGDDNRVQRSSCTKYVLPRVNITNYNVLIDGRNFYDQLISDEIRKNDEIRKEMIKQQDIC